MHTDNLVINDSRTGQAIEGIAELLPHLNGEAATALVVKAINSVDTCTFMISSQKKEVLGILNLVGE